jgi:hypothetical protein
MRDRGLLGPNAWFASASPEKELRSQMMHDFDPNPILEAFLAAGIRNESHGRISPTTLE